MKISRFEDIVRDQLVCVSLGREFIPIALRNKDVEIKATWGRVKKMYGQEATNLKVESKPNPLVNVDPFGPPVLTAASAKAAKFLALPAPSPRKPVTVAAAAGKKEAANETIFEIATTTTTGDPDCGETKTTTTKQRRPRTAKSRTNKEQPQQQLSNEESSTKNDKTHKSRSPSGRKKSSSKSPNAKKSSRSPPKKVQIDTKPLFMNNGDRDEIEIEEQETGTENNTTIMRTSSNEFSFNSSSYSLHTTTKKDSVQKNKAADDEVAAVSYEDFYETNFDDENVGELLK